MHIKDYFPTETELQKNFSIFKKHTELLNSLNATDELYSFNKLISINYSVRIYDRSTLDENISTLWSYIQSNSCDNSKDKFFLGLRLRYCFCLPYLIKGENTQLIIPTSPNKSSIKKTISTNNSITSKNDDPTTFMPIEKLNVYLTEIQTPDLKQNLNNITMPNNSIASIEELHKYFSFESIVPSSILSISEDEFKEIEYPMLHNAILMLAIANGFTRYKTKRIPTYATYIKNTNKTLIELLNTIEYDEYYRFSNFRKFPSTAICESFKYKLSLLFPNDLGTCTSWLISLNNADAKNRSKITYNNIVEKLIEKLSITFFVFPETYSNVFQFIKEILNLLHKKLIAEEKKIDIFTPTLSDPDKITVVDLLQCILSQTLAFELLSNDNYFYFEKYILTIFDIYLSYLHYEEMDILNKHPQLS